MSEEGSNCEHSFENTAHNSAQPSRFVYVKQSPIVCKLQIPCYVYYSYSPEKSQLLHIPETPIWEETIAFKLYIT